MSTSRTKQTTRKLTAAEKAKHAETQRKIEKEFPPGKPVKRKSKPSEPATLGEYFDLRGVVNELRKAREAQGLSLTDIHNATGIDRSALCRLENGDNVNPTINTLRRYARAVRRRLAMSVEK